MGEQRVQHSHGTGHQQIEGQPAQQLPSLSLQQQKARETCNLCYEEQRMKQQRGE
ncbi:hypothetical protein D3C75_1067200 [compost metagenome]